ncbi:hypothetical protein [Magnetovibrio blakemorei]|uniref:Translin n=1 Tax=Magnetovibrio blakemorei TaxID=28181 RepID=A0A1E5Q9I0_9PROT|nr:hypothetical protein [Magnetovibrio blakemorei]OEJ68226.1 hypothetical protein BEN30_06805 [Magnetovibrio blakemorei]
MSRPNSRLTEEQRLIELARIADRRAEVEEFVNILEGRVNTLKQISQKLQDLGDEVYTYHFLEFQRVVSENLAFIIIIEGRLATQPQGEKDELLEKFDDLIAAIWSIVLTGSLSFLTTISNDEYLPLGSREVFVHELRSLNDARIKLTDERFKSRLNKSTLIQVDKAERILSEVIEKAPKLLLF